jgi:tryptophan synthase alpha chain
VTSQRRLAEVLSAARQSGRAAFVPFLTAGDPSLEWTGRFVEGLATAGAGAVELGVPCSDPIADGPTIQEASERALDAGATLQRVLDLVRRLRERGVAVPILLFTYYNPVLRMGLGSFARGARIAGAQGALVVDLPPEEAGDYRRAVAKAGLETVFLASPTTSDERLGVVDDASTAFVYYVARLGVTGARASLPRSLRKRIAWVRRRVTKPLAVGFGISTPAQARTVAPMCDAVVVGSALVRLVAENPPEAAGRKMRALAAAIVEAMGSVSGRRP